MKATLYKISFISEDNERISNEVRFIVDSRDKDSQNRIFRLKFQFRDKKYDRQKQYYLVICDDTGLETARHPMIIDLTFDDEVDVDCDF